MLDTTEATITDTAVVDQVSIRSLNRLQDRCDRCGAEAFMLAAKDELEILFCGHHGQKHLDALVGSGWTIQDERDRINSAPSPSANHDPSEEEYNDEQ